MWKAVVVGCGIAALATFSVAGVLRSGPGSYRLERAIRIAAPSETVQARIADVREWTTWPPWQRGGRDLGGKLAGPRSGPGASYFWDGGDQAGATVPDGDRDDVRSDDARRHGHQHRRKDLHAHPGRPTGARH